MPLTSQELADIAVIATYNNSAQSAGNPGGFGSGGHNPLFIEALGRLVRLVQAAAREAVSAGTNWRGEWSSATSYAIGDGVTYQGSSWRALAAGVNHAPPDPATVFDAWWFLVAAKGAGVPGQDGRTILNGDGAPSNGLGADGDFYFDKTASRLYGPKTAGAWGGFITVAGADGAKGWAPLMIFAADGERRVMQLQDWVGGEGAKPTTPAIGLYLALTGWTATIGDAVDLRGPPGAGSGDVSTTGAVVVDEIAGFADNTGDLLKSTGVKVADLVRKDVANTLAEPLTLPGNATEPGHAVPKQQMDTAISAMATTAGENLAAAIGFLETSDITTTAYTIQITDRGKKRRYNNGSPGVITIPTHAAVAFPVGGSIQFDWKGVGQPSFAPASGVTLNSEGGKRKIGVRYGAATLTKDSTTEWTLYGNLAS